MSNSQNSRNLNISVNMNELAEHSVVKGAQIHEVKEEELEESPLKIKQA